MSKIRCLRASDLPELVELSRVVGWNQTAEDWERMLALAGETSYGIESQGKVVATSAGICYGRDVAWIGMVITHPDNRGKGLARALFEHTLNQLRPRVRWIKLDATDQGRPLYKSYGFRDEVAVERWRRPAGSGSAPAAPRVAPYVIDPSFDRAYFGANRVALLASLIKHGAAMVTGYGYAMGRPGARAAYFGPCVVRTRVAARTLLEWFLSRHPGEEVYWDLFPDNKDAVQLAIDYGFEPARHLMRMGVPCAPDERPLVKNDSSIFAIAGFEYG